MEEERKLNFRSALLDSEPIIVEYDENRASRFRALVKKYEADFKRARDAAWQEWLYSVRDEKKYGS